MTIPEQHRLTGGWRKIILVCLALGWLTLPFSQLRWLPDLGTTRPLCVFFFAAAIFLQYTFDLHNGPRTWKRLLGWDFIQTHLIHGPGGAFLRWWLLLCALGVASAAITPFYGSPFQALSRLLGYLIILVYLYSALLSLELAGAARIATWIHAGYVPVLIYAGVEALAQRQVAWAAALVAAVRQAIIVPFNPQDRMAWFCTEPSFVAFQVILLLATLPFLRQRWLRATSLALIGLAAWFTQSGMVWMLLACYLAGLVFFSLTHKTRLWLTASSGGAAGVLTLGYLLSPALQSRLAEGWVWLLAHNLRLHNMNISVQIRLNYIFNLFYTLLDTYGLGLGIGQYGLFWKEIYQRHIDYRAFDPTGEVAAALASDGYMRPWSVILGVGVDLSVIGLGIFALMLVQLWRYLPKAHARGIFVASLAGIAGAYPIVMPHIWLALALLGGVGALAAQAKTE
jgi:hypothetical protein